MTKTSIKLRFRSSSVAGREGTLYIQIIHERKVRHLTSDYHIYNDEWNEAKSMIANVSNADRNHLLAGIRECIRNDHKRLNRIVADFEHKGLPFEADDIIAEYHRIISEHTLFTFMEGVIAQLKQMGKTRTAETYRATLNSYCRFRNGEDIMLEDISSD